jgi:hypothetical protein
MLEFFTAASAAAPSVMAFLIAHWDTVMAVVTAIVTAIQILSTGQHKALWPLALDAVRKVAELELSGPEKRAKVVDTLLMKAPAWVKMVPRPTLEKLAEQAYQFLRGELKQEGK